MRMMNEMRRGEKEYWKGILRRNIEEQIRRGRRV
jgi:hypothetical protein